MPHSKSPRSRRSPSPRRGSSTSRKDETTSRSRRSRSTDKGRPGEDAINTTSSGRRQSTSKERRPGNQGDKKSPHRKARSRSPLRRARGKSPPRRARSRSRSPKQATKGRSPRRKARSRSPARQIKGKSPRRSGRSRSASGSRAARGVRKSPDTKMQRADAKSPKRNVDGGRHHDADSTAGHGGTYHQHGGLEGSADRGSSRAANLLKSDQNGSASSDARRQTELDKPCDTQRPDAVNADGSSRRDMGRRENADTTGRSDARNESRRRPDSNVDTRRDDSRHGESDARHHRQSDARDKHSDKRHADTSKQARDGDHSQGRRRSAESTNRSTRQPLPPRDPSPVPVTRRYDQTSMSLEARFSELDPSSFAPRFVPDENITIEIERKISGHHVPFRIPLVVVADCVVVAQQRVGMEKEERMPLHLRPEFLTREEDNEEELSRTERRVVKLKTSSLGVEGSGATKRRGEADEKKAWRDNSSDDEFSSWKEVQKRARVNMSTSSTTLFWKVNERGVVEEVEGGGADRRRVERRSQDMDTLNFRHIQNKDGGVAQRLGNKSGRDDSSHGSNRRERGEGGAYDRSMTEGHGRPIREGRRDDHRPIREGLGIKDLRDELLNRVNRDSDRKRSLVDTSTRSATQSLMSAKDRLGFEIKRTVINVQNTAVSTGDPATVELPDFSRRADKYKYDAWKEKPELIPKGPSYYEHDNRDEEYDTGGRGSRGGGRGNRGGGRFLARDSNVNRSSRVQSAWKRSDPLRTNQWKHDKFEELQDDKPSSTTEIK